MQPDLVSVKATLESALEAALESLEGTGLTELMNSLVVGVIFAAETASRAAASVEAASKLAAGGHGKSAAVVLTVSDGPMTGNLPTEDELAALRCDATGELRETNALTTKATCAPVSSSMTFTDRLEELTAREAPEAGVEHHPTLVGATMAPPPLNEGTLHVDQTMAERRDHYQERLHRARSAKAVSAGRSESGGSDSAAVGGERAGRVRGSVEPSSSLAKIEESQAPQDRRDAAVSLAAFGLEALSLTDEIASLLSSTIEIGSRMCEGIGREVSDDDAATAAGYFQHGVLANQASNFSAASSWFEASQRLCPRLSTLLSIAEMRLQLGDGALAAYLYSFILSHPLSSREERQVCGRKLRLAHAQLQALQPEGGYVKAVGGVDGSSGVGGKKQQPLHEQRGEGGAALTGAPVMHQAAKAAAVRLGEVEVVALLEEASATHAEEMAKLVAMNAAREGALEEMLRELTVTMRSEMSRRAEAEERHAREKVELLRERERLLAADGGVVRGVEAAEVAEALSQLSEEVVDRLSALAACKVAELSSCASLTRAALQLIRELHEQKLQLSEASEVMMAAHTDAVRKLAASSSNSGPALSAVVGTWIKSVSARRGSAPSAELSELARKDLEIAELRRVLQMVPPRITEEPHEPATTAEAEAMPVHVAAVGEADEKAAGVGSAERHVSGQPLAASFTRMKAALSSLLAELERNAQAPNAEELMQLWAAALRHHRGDEASAVGLIEEHLVWRSKSPYPGVVDIDHIPTSLLTHELTCGLLYLEGCDREGRAVIVFNVHKHTTTSPWYDKKRMLCAVVFVIEQALYESKHPSRQFVLLCNLHGFGPRNFDQYLIGRAFRVIFQNYPDAMHACLLANAPVVFNAAWAILRTWIPPDLVNLFHFVDERGISEVIETTLVEPGEHAVTHSQARIAPYIGLMVGHMRRARGASTSVALAPTAPQDQHLLKLECATDHTPATAAPTPPSPHNPCASASSGNEEASFVIQPRADAQLSDASSSEPFTLGGSLSQLQLHHEDVATQAVHTRAQPLKATAANVSAAFSDDVSMSTPPTAEPPSTDTNLPEAAPELRDGCVASTPQPSDGSEAQSTKSYQPTPLTPPLQCSQLASLSSAPQPSGVRSALQNADTFDARAEAVEYVDTLIARADRASIPEHDVKQALAFFEQAKKANADEDYKAASSFFEASFLLNPKLSTLISTANMQLKLKKPAIAAEIYTRLLQMSHVPDRERQVALRKLAICQTMLSEEDIHDTK